MERVLYVVAREQPLLVGYLRTRAGARPPKGGIVEIVKEYYPDPSDRSGRFGMVDVRAVAPFKTAVTLARIKEDPQLADLPLVRQSRLSVMPIPAAAWKTICKWGGVPG